MTKTKKTEESAYEKQERLITKWNVTKPKVGANLLLTLRLLIQSSALGANAATSDFQSLNHKNKLTLQQAKTLYCLIIAKLLISFNKCEVNHQPYLLAYQQNRGFFGRVRGDAFTDKYRTKPVSNYIADKLAANSLDTATVKAVNGFLKNNFTLESEGIDHLRLITNAEDIKLLREHLSKPAALAASPTVR